MNDTLHTWAAALSAEAPAGSDVTYDPRFEQIATEIEKLSSVTGGRPDWRLIVEQGEGLLTTTSKDLRLCAWVTLAKVNVQSWTGLVGGLEGTLAVVSTHWDAIHPPLKRMRARVNLIDWLWNQLPTAIAALPTTESDGPTCDAAEAAFAALTSVLDGKFEGASPSSRDVRNALAERKRNIPRPAPVVVEAPPAPPVVAPPTPSNVQPSDSSGPAVTQPVVVSTPTFGSGAAQVPAAVEAASLDQAMDIARNWSELLFGLARQARRAAPMSGWPYRLTRTAAWLTVEGLPEIEEEDRIYVRGPRAADVRTLTELLSRSDWSDLLDASEESLLEHPFWLDLHRFSALALEHLGHREARAAVGREASALVQRLPKLTELKFSGGSPLASPDTRAWFEQEMSAWGGGGGGRSAATEDIDTELIDQARLRIGSGDVLGGVAQALRAARELPSAKRRFRARAHVADMALTAGDAAVAKAIAEELVAEVQPSVEAWAPDDVGLCYQVFVRAERNLAEASKRPTDERVESILKRLLMLDPESALRLWR